MERSWISPEEELVVLPGGSIFCTCLVTQFIQTLTAIADHADQHGLDGLVIEASGVANPKVVEKMLQETQLDQRIALCSIISIVDPGSFPTLLQTLPNIVAQIEASDRALLNKTDLFDEEEMAVCEEELRRIRPGIEIVRTSFCAAELDLFATHEERGLEGEYASCADPNYARFVVRPEGDVDLCCFS